MRKYIINCNNVTLFIILSIVANVLLALFFRMYGNVTEIATGLEESIKPLAVSTVFVIVGMFCFFSACDYIKCKIVGNSCKKLRNDIMAKIYSQDYNIFYGKNTSYYSSMLLNDVELVENNFFKKTIEIVEETVQLCVMLIFILFIEWRFGLVISIFVLPSVLQPFALRGKLGRIGKSVSNKYETYTKAVREYIGGFEVIKIFQKERVMTEKFSQNVRDMEATRKKSLMINALNVALMLFTMYFLKIGLALFFVNSAIMGIISIAAVTALFGFANQIGNPIASILCCIAAMNENKNVREKLTCFLAQDTKQDYYSKTGVSFSNGIRFENVRFIYPDQQKEVLNGFTISLQKGKKYLFLGKSGVGKSTIMRIIMGNLNQYSGNVFIDDVEIRSINSRIIRNSIALIDQNAFIFNGTILDNITLFNEKRYSQEQIADAIQRAGLKTFIDSLPMGVETIVCKSGKEFSDGEKQRISIARAFIADKDLIIADECTARLDNATSIEVERNLLSTDKTVFVIAHRIHETISAYDGIVYINNKKLAAFGTYEELQDNILFSEFISNIKEK